MGVALLEGAAWHVVDAAGDGVDVGLGVDGQVGALRQPAAHEAVEVLVDGTLPGGVGISEVEGGAENMFDVRSQRHLSALIPSEGALACLRDRAQQPYDTRRQRCCVVAVGQCPKQAEACGAVDDRDDRRGVFRADDQVTFEMPDLRAASGGRWALVDRLELAQHEASLLPREASPPARAALVVQMTPQPWIEPAVSWVARLVDRLMTYVLGSSDRHRRLLVLHQAPSDTPSQRSVFHQPRWLGPTSTAFRSTLRTSRHIAYPTAVAVHCASDRRHRPPEPPGDHPQRLASHQPDPDLLPLFQPEASTWHAKTPTGGCYLSTDHHGRSVATTGRASYSIVDEG